jgi:hypothetical protein
MKSAIAYYLGNLGTDEYSDQSKKLRQIVLSDKSDSEIVLEFQAFVLNQLELEPDTVKIINRAIMTSIGSEYLGLYGDDFSLKAEVYKSFIQKFPLEYSFKFYYADCCQMTNVPIEEFYPILRDGMLSDKENNNYPTSDLFYMIHSSEYSFDFDMLLLNKYYQPCTEEEFREWIDEFKDVYKNEEQQEYLDKLKWKGEVTQEK